MKRHCPLDEPDAVILPFPGVDVAQDAEEPLPSIELVQAPSETRKPTLKSRLKPFLGAIVVAPLFVLAYCVAFWLRFDGLSSMNLDRLGDTLPWVLVVKVLVFGTMRATLGWRRSANFYDMVTLVKAATVSLAALALVDRFLTLGIPRSIFLIDWGTTVVLMGGARAACRGFRELSWRRFLTRDSAGALIVGAGEAGELILRSIVHRGPTGCRVLGFLDANHDLVGARIGGARVLGTLDDLERIAGRLDVRQLLIVQQAISGQRLRGLMDRAARLKIEVRVLPSYEQLIDGHLAIQPRPVAIDDLLHRDPVRLDLRNIRELIDGRTLLVTGSAGSIGSEICRQLLQFSPRKLIAVDRSETGQFFLEKELRELAGDVELEVTIADVLDQRRIQALFEEHRPEVVFHAAAYKHVPLMEAHPGEAVKNIVVATRRLADAAIDAGVETFVMISTDKAVNPTSVMGACKRVAELYVQSLVDQPACRFVTVRFGNVLDSAGSVVQVFRRQIAAGGPVTVTHPDMQRYFMTIPEAARLVLQAGGIGEGGQILILDMGEPVLISALAEDMIRLSGYRVGDDVAIEHTGLRPGEKLFEELLVSSERRLPTSHPKITVACGRIADRFELLRAMTQLERLADLAPDEVRDAIAEIVPEYRPRTARPRLRVAA